MPKSHYRPYNQNQLVLFPQRVDARIGENDPVRIVSAIIDQLDLTQFKKLYREVGRSPYHPQMMLKVIVYAYMNNIYSCRKIEKLLLRDTHFIWLSGDQHPDFITINRFRNRVKKEINQVFTQLVLILADKGVLSLNVEYIDGTKIESKANKYTFVWRKTVEKNKAKLQAKVSALLKQIDDVIIQDKIGDEEPNTITAAVLSDIVSELKESLKKEEEDADDVKKKP